MTFLGFHLNWFTVLFCRRRPLFTLALHLHWWQVCSHRLHKSLNWYINHLCTPLMQLRTMVTTQHVMEIWHNHHISWAKNVEHEPEKTDVLLWQHHLDEHFSSSWDEQCNFLGILFFFWFVCLFQHIKFAEKSQVPVGGQSQRHLTSTLSTQVCDLWMVSSSPSSHSCANAQINGLGIYRGKHIVL